MDTKTMDRARRKAVKRAIRKHRRATTSLPAIWIGERYLGPGPARRRAGRTRMAFASAWNGAVRAGCLHLPLISGITLLPYAVAALPSATATTSES